MLKNKLKLLVVIPTFYPELKYGGPIIALYNQLYHLSKEIYLEVAVERKYHQKNHNKLKNNKHINYIINYFDSKIKYLKSFFLIKKFDVVYINSIFSFHCLLFLALSIIFKKKVFISPRGSINIVSLNKKWFLKKIIIFIVNILPKKYIRIVATSNLEKNHIKKYMRYFKIIVIPNGMNNLDLNISEKKINIPNQNFLKKSFIFFSRIDKKKNLDKLVNIIIKSKFNLIIIGSIYDKNYFKKISIDNKKIEYLGPIYNKNTLKKIFNYSIGLCLPSNFENFANVVIDSVGMDCPVLLSPHIGLSKIIKKNNFGMVYENEEIKIEDLSQFQKNSIKMKNNIIKNKLIFLNDYNWASINKKFISNFKK